MKNVFADTQGWIALNHKRDQFHKQAVTIKKQILKQGGKFITTNFVLDETYTLLQARLSHKAAMEFGKIVQNSSSITVIRITEEIEEEAWHLFEKYSDKQFSFTDCTSFSVMQKHGLSDAYTNDHHFEQMGFSILLK